VGGVVLDTFAVHAGGAFETATVQSDGKIVAARYTDRPAGSPNQAFALSRYLS